MLNELLPTAIDNTYRGQKAALWLLAFVALSKVVMGLNCMFNGYYVAATADGIPLGAYSAAATQTILAIFAAWGLSTLVFGLLSALVLARYRGMVPFMLTLLLAEHLARRLIFVLLPIDRIEGSKGWLVNAVLLAAMALGLGLSLWPRGGARTRAEG